jgi:hypothetical protein
MRVLFPNKKPDNSNIQKLILKWISGKQGLGMWIGFIWLRIGIGGGFL